MRYALSLTAQQSKAEIIKNYLNTIPFAYEVTGRRAACQRYRWRTCEKIGTQKTRILITMMQRSYNPYRTEHQAKILSRIQMYQRVRPDLFATWFTIDQTIFDDLTDAEPTLDPRVAEILTLTNPAWVTTFDSKLSDNIDYILDKSTTLRQEFDVQHCCVLTITKEWHLRSANICTPRDDPIDGKINACLIPRQTWSSIKPLLYAFAFDKLWLKGDDTIVDEPVAYTLGDWSLYTPQNFDLTNHGDVSLAFALGNSLNIPAVKLLDQVGVREFLSFLQDRWTQYIPQIPLNQETTDNLWLSLALGSYEMSPLVLTQLRRFFTPTNQTSYQSQANEVRTILGDYKHKITSFGQDGLLDTPWRSLKTGTSRHFIDGWICGIHQMSFDIVCIRLGNYDNSPMKGASSEVGSYIWSQVVGQWNKE
jgi:penicillin-binding protein 1C